MRFMVLALLAVAGAAEARSAGDEPLDPDWRPKAEHRILERLIATPPGALKCDFVLNSAPPFEAPVPGHTTVLNFWRPSCEPCKPLLDELAAFAKGARPGVVVLAAVEGGAPLGQRPDPIAVRAEVGGLVRAHGVAFPVCAYTDHAQTKRWQAEGVPLTLFFDEHGRVRRVAIGAVEASAALKQLREGWRP